MDLLEWLRYYTFIQIRCAVDRACTPDIIFLHRVTGQLYRPDVNTVTAIKECLTSFRVHSLSEKLNNVIDVLVERKLDSLENTYQIAFNKIPAPITSLPKEKQEDLYKLTLFDVVQRRGSVNGTLFTVNGHSSTEDFQTIELLKTYWRNCGIAHSALVEYLALYLNAEFLLMVGVEKKTEFIEKNNLLLLEEVSGDLTLPTSSSMATQAAQTVVQYFAGFVYETDHNTQEPSIEINSQGANALTILMTTPYHAALSTLTNTIQKFNPPFIIQTTVMLTAETADRVVISQVHQQFFNQHVLPSFGIHTPLPCSISHSPMPSSPLRLPSVASSSNYATPLSGNTPCPSPARLRAPVSSSRPTTPC